MGVSTPRSARDETHPEAHDATGARVDVRSGGCGAAGEQELPAGAIIVHQTPHRVPYFGKPLPLIDQHGPRCRSQLVWGRTNQLGVG